MPKPLEEVTSYRARRARMMEMLTTLLESGDIIGYQTKGRDGKSASTLFRALIPENNLTHSSFTNDLNDLADAGWLDVKTNGKRTEWIKLKAHVPKKYRTREVVQPTSDTQTVGSDADLFPSPSLAPADEALPPLTQAEDEDAELGMRPGRLAHRLEKSIPDATKAAVREVLGEVAGEVLGVLGYFRGVDPAQFAEHEAEIAKLTADVARLQSTIESLAENRRRLEAMVDWLKDQDDAKLVKTNEGQIASGKGGLTVSRLPDAFKRTGAWAIEHGWTIFNTRGGHLMWRSPEMKTTFSPSTPSNDFTSDQILWRKLRRLGLEDFRGRTQDNANEGRWSGDHNRDEESGYISG